MVLDYHDKRTTQKIDRKPVQKNRPRRQSYGVFLVAGVAALALSFGAGLLTGRILYRTPQVAAPPVVAQAAPKKEDAAAAQAKAPAAEPSLTFYNTLPAGSKGAIGSGINTNLKKPEAPPAQSAAPAPAADAESAAKTAPAEGRFVVQVASYRDKAEADAAQAKLAEKGLAAYVAESRSQENGVWYRLRIGKRLSKEDAEGISAKVGKGAIVLPE
ncbi:SPOR domain-containing protein [Geomonas sp. RF6]|uniref:SPOR domain-containing protein n=1 Tax=Geomonas sp. RF6 TaxID=2897342 RepID=UPI001E4D685E|nr:SPOR domain-containing protein [Geomonas sp. RF6]UFS69863.1 SPOR domain-containing protein [Geomonas sp. RF6]